MTVQYHSALFAHARPTMFYIPLVWLIDNDFSVLIASSEPEVLTPWVIAITALLVKEWLLQLPFYDRVQVRFTAISSPFSSHSPWRTSMVLVTSQELLFSDLSLVPTGVAWLHLDHVMICTVKKRMLDACLKGTSARHKTFCTYRCTTCPWQHSCKMLLEIQTIENPGSGRDPDDCIRI